MPKADRAGVSYENGAGTARTKSSVSKETWTDPDPILKINEDIYEKYNEPGVAGLTGKRLLWRNGDLVRTSKFDASFPAATAVSVTPATGAAAGGTAITIKGTNLRGSTGGTIGGNALTSYVVVNDTTATAVTPAHAAGAVALTITDDSGTSASLASAFTYV